MSPNLLELTQNYFLGSTVRQVSTVFGEPEDRLSAALRTVVPLVLGGLLTRAQEPGGAAELTTWAQQVHQRGLLRDLSGLLAGLSAPADAMAPAAGRLPTRGADLMRTLLGAAYGPALSGISQQAGVRTTTVSNLFSVAVAAVLGLLGRHITQHSLDAEGLRNYLGSQRADILGALATLPAGLGQGLAHPATGTPVAEVVPALVAPEPSRDSPIPMRPVEAPLRSAPPAVASSPPVAPSAPAVVSSGTTPVLSSPAVVPSSPSVTSPLAAAQPVVRAAPPRPAVRPVAPAVTRRWPWLLLLALSLAIAGYFVLGRRPPVVTSEPVVPTPAAPARLDAPATRGAAPSGQYEAASDTYRSATGASITLRLPTGTSFAVGSHSAEVQLWQLLTDSTQSLTSAENLRGIVLDRIYFDAGHATLTTASQPQIANLAALLAAFPRATLKFGGFTDNQGAAEANLLLSTDRANAVRNALLAQGIAPTRVAAQGYGQTHPLASNATLAGQAQNRRVAVLLTSR
ncbi:MAG: OmpA family protein [Janthinobacterium lividum]